MAVSLCMFSARCLESMHALWKVAIHVAMGKKNKHKTICKRKALKLALFIHLYMALPLVNFFSLGALTCTGRDTEQQGTGEAAEL